MMRNLLKKIKPFCFLLVLALMCWGLWNLRDTLQQALRTADWVFLCLATLLSLVYLFLNASVWGAICQLLGSKSSRWQGALLWIECEAMRYLPGGIWGYASRVVEARKLGLNKTSGALSLALELTLTIFSWCILGAIGTLFSPRLREALILYLERLSLPSPHLLFLLTLGAGLLLSILFWKNGFSIRTHFWNASSDLRNALLSHWKRSLQALVEYLSLGILYALGLLLCLQSIHASVLPTIAETICAYSIAWIVGFLAIGSPGGIGVREGFLYLVFHPLGIAEEVATAAILWRAIQILTEICTVSVIKILKRSPSP